MTSGVPRPGRPVPGRVRALAGGDEVRPVWVNQTGGVTFEIGWPGGRRFVKWAPRGSRLPAEAARLAWAAAFITVPPVLGWGGDRAGWWIVTGALAGQMAVTERWKAEPRTAVTALAGDGRCCGHVDLGALGLADRWADLAVATWSVGWNFGPDWEATLLDAYGVPPDPDRTRYYRLLYDLGP